ncbi:LysR family transcriptional regulator [Streptomyces sp. M19]
MAHIERVDLNLLAPLAALLAERHVSRAADVAGMSQPAMSRALQRLRETLGDELLVRTPGGYRLTPRAERVQRELRTVLPRLESLFAPEEFDPAEAFRVAGTDYAQVFAPRSSNASSGSRRAPRCTSTPGTTPSTRTSTGASSTCCATPGRSR